MANVINKAERLTSGALAVLDREIALPQLVTRDMGGDWVGAKNDTIQIGIDSFVTGRRRTGGLRGTADLETDDFVETTVDVKLDVHAYKRTGVSLAQLTLDVMSYERQVAVPAVKAVAREIEDVLVEAVDGATYAIDVGAVNASDPWVTMMSMRTALNKARVPLDSRFLAVGADVEDAFLKSNRLKADESLDPGALRDAAIGRVGGSLVVSIPGMNPKAMVYAHRSAFALGVKSPDVPAGAKGGAARAFNGLAMTSIFDYDSRATTDTFGVHSFVGASVVSDAGVLAADGRFTPAVTPAANGSDKILVRAARALLA